LSNLETVVVRGSVLDDFTERSFDEQVEMSLAETRFSGDENRVGVESEFRWKRASDYHNCCKVVTGRRCVNCKFELFRYSRKCHLRGCKRCGPSVRLLLSNRYFRRLRRFPLGQLHFLTFTGPFAESGQVEDFLLGCVEKVYRRFRWRGMLASLELKSKVGDLWYVHVHAIVLCDYYHSVAVKQLWYSLTGFDIVKEKPVYSLNGLVGYVTGYALKGFEGITSSASKLVGVMRSLYRKRLVRAFGVFRGDRRSREPVGVVGFGAARSEAPFVSSSSSSHELDRIALSPGVCPRCGGTEFEFFTETLPGALAPG
jgi:hypothetical protein